MTIFEIKEKKTKNSDLSNAANVMRQLKSKNSHIIEKFKGILVKKFSTFSFQWFSPLKFDKVLRNYLEHSQGACKFDDI